MNKKIAVFTLNIDDYAPEICQHTIPNLQAWASQLGASFEIITQRKYTEHTDWPVTLEKFQMYEKAIEMDLDYAIFLDADMAVSPALSNPTLALGADSAFGRWQEYDHVSPTPLFKVPPGTPMYPKAIVTSYICVPRAMFPLFLFDKFKQDVPTYLSECERPFIVDEYIHTRIAAAHSLVLNGIVSNQSHVFHAEYTSNPNPQTLAGLKKFLAEVTSITNVSHIGLLSTYLRFKNLNQHGILVGPYMMEALNSLIQGNWPGHSLLLDSWSDYPPAEGILTLALLMEKLKNPSRKFSFFDTSIATWRAPYMVVDKSADFVFCGHPQLDIAEWLSKVKPGGLICGACPPDVFQGYVQHMLNLHVLKIWTPEGPGFQHELMYWFAEVPR